MITIPVSLRVLQRGHKLAKGVIFAFAPGQGGMAYNLAKQQFGSINAGTPTLSATGWGMAASTDGTGDSYAFTGFPTTFSELTVLWVGIVTANASGFNEIMLHTSTSGNNGWYAVPYRVAGAGYMSFTKGGVIEALSTTLITTFGTRYAMCFAGSDTADLVRCDLSTGNVATDLGISLSGTPAAGNGTFSMGHYGDTGALPGFGLEGSTNLCIVWDRRLNLDEMLTVVRNPFGLVTPRRREIVGKATVAAGGADAVPQCWAQYRRRRAG